MSDSGRVELRPFNFVSNSIVVVVVVVDFDVMADWRAKAISPASRRCLAGRNIRSARHCLTSTDQVDLPLVSQPVERPRNRLQKRHTVDELKAERRTDSVVPDVLASDGEKSKYTHAESRSRIGATLRVDSHFGRCSNVVRSVYYFASMDGCEVLRSACMSVCLWVCLSARISKKANVQTSRLFLYNLHMTMARPVCNHSAICYVLLVLYTTSRFRVIVQI